MVTIAMGEDMMSPKTIATEVHSSDGRHRRVTVDTGHKIPIAKVEHPRRYRCVL
jgi:hypothetical protein